MKVSGPLDVLIVEDEVDLAEGSVEYLRAFGLAADWVSSAEAALAELRHVPPRLLLLDINLPGKSGFDLCRTTRAAHPDLPIIFLSARASDDDEILALGIGGDDYIRKPVSLAVLLAKVRRSLARRDPAAPPEAPFDDGWLRWDPAADRMWVDGVELVLPAMEHRLLRYFFANAGRVLSKAELFGRVWGEPLTGDGTLTVHVRRLRMHIERDPDKPTYLRTVHGRGYLFETGEEATA